MEKSSISKKRYGRKVLAFLLALLLTIPNTGTLGLGSFESKAEPGATTLTLAEPTVNLDVASGEVSLAGYLDGATITVGGEVLADPSEALATVTWSGEASTDAGEFVSATKKFTPAASLSSADQATVTLTAHLAASGDDWGAAEASLTINVNRKEQALTLSSPSVSLTYPTAQTVTVGNDVGTLSFEGASGYASMVSPAFGTGDQDHA